MQDLLKRDEANSTDPVIGETVYVNSYACRGIVKSIHQSYGQTSYEIAMENEVVTRRLRREIVRVVQ